MNLPQFLNYLLCYGCYLLGAIIFILDLMKKYELMAGSNPDEEVKFDSSLFWRKERINIIKIFLLGLVSMVLLIPLDGISLDFVNTAGDLMFTVNAKTAMLPVYLILGWSGGRGTIALAGQYKKGFYKKVGLENDKDNGE